MADRKQLESRWDEMKGRVKQAWGALTDDEMTEMEGRWDRVVATIRRKTGESIDTIENKLDEMIDSLGEPSENVRS